MPQAHYGQPQKVADGRVHYPSGVVSPVGNLSRQDLMRVAGAIAKSKGEKTGGTSWRNDQLSRYIKDNQPWEAQGTPEPSPKPGNPQDRVPTEVICACGHTYTYRIKAGRLEATKAWLATKPCPSCAKQKPGESPKPGQPKPPKETPEENDDMPEEEDDLEETPQQFDGDLDKLADALVQKVLERLKPVKMPEMHHEILPEVIKALNADVPVWLQGPPGTSKSTIAAQAAGALGLALHAISCHEGMTRSDLFGYTDANGTDHRSPLWDAYENGGVLLLDEIDNGNANILAALNSALSNGHCTFAGKTVSKHESFKVVATANTAGLGPESGFIGRMGVDLATLDRFVSIPCPIDNKLEMAIVKSLHPDGYAPIMKAVRKLRKAVEARGLRVVVSPRTSIHAAKMGKLGTPLAECFRRTALKGVDESTVAALLQEAGVDG